MDQMNHLRDQEIGMMADMHDSERLRGFGNRWTDRWTDICDCRVAFTTENCFGVFGKFQILDTLLQSVKNEIM